MSPETARRAAYGGLAALYLLHNDFWLWDDGRLVLGLPVGLAYHVGYCIAAAALMTLLVRRAWPGHLEDAAPTERPPAVGGGRREGGL